MWMQIMLFCTKEEEEEVNNFERKCGETSQWNVQTYLGH
jgi:hypothetical protein